MDDEAKEQQPLSPAQQWALETEAALAQNQTWAATRARLAAGCALKPPGKDRK